jgi:hypothetical protein
LEANDTAAESVLFHVNHALCKLSTQQAKHTEIVAELKTCVAGLQADKLQLSYSVETKLECLNALEAQNASLRCRVEELECERNR